MQIVLFSMAEPSTSSCSCRLTHAGGGCQHPDRGQQLCRPAAVAVGQATWAALLALFQDHITRPTSSMHKRDTKRLHACRQGMPSS